MPDLVYPIQRFGSTDLLLYRERDYYGVEQPAAALSDYRGPNEIFDWTRRARSAALVEHYGNGVHNTLKIARALLVINCNPGSTTYSFDPSSYIQSTTGLIQTGAAVGSIARTGVGALTITLAYAMPSINYGLLDFTCPYWTTDYNQQNITQWSRVWLRARTSTTAFTVRRYSWTSFAAQALSDGFMRFAIHGAV